AVLVLASPAGADCLDPLDNDLDDDVDPRDAACMAIFDNSQRAGNSTLRMITTLGDIELELFDSLRPVSVNNFLNYVDDGDYTNSIVHRSVPGFVIQGGGFTFADGSLDDVPTDPPFQDTPGPSNLRGTIAMAENSAGATSQWFINLADNPFLDPDFTVFGEVTSGMDVVDAIALVPRFDAGSPFSDLPLRNYTPRNSIEESNFIFATVPEPRGAWLGMVALATITLARRLSSRG
ncbi:MAG: peptidylprolyl isomerase, partial [Myxococcota bacterium]